jgi:hypothetical protein
MSSWPIVLDTIIADRQLAYGVFPGGVGQSLKCDSSLLVGDRHSGSWYQFSRRIGDGAQNTSCNVLAEQRQRADKSHSDGYKRA